MKRKENKLDKIKELYNKYKEIVNYLFFGGCTFVVNFVTYGIFAKMLGINEIISNIIAWVVAVLFAYITNKLFVFESKTKDAKSFLKEMASFMLARVFSGITCDVGTFALMINVFHINDIFSKVVTQIMVIIVNYVLSKMVVFRKKETKI